MKGLRNPNSSTKMDDVERKAILKIIVAIFQEYLEERPRKDSRDGAQDTYVSGRTKRDASANFKQEHTAPLVIVLEDM